MSAAQPPRTTKVGIHVALLRGINVGGRNRLPMAHLVTMFENAGCRHVRTYIQSGNVVFETPAATARLVPAAVTTSIEAECGFRVPILIRTATDLERIVRTNPFVEPGTDLGLLHVGFLADRPSAARVATLDPHRSPPDEFAQHEREIYLRCPNGMARTKLTTAYFDARLQTVATFRNWRTTLELLALSGATASRR